MRTSFRSVKTISLVFAAIMLAIANSAHADIYVESFDGPLNPAIWNLNTGGNDWVVDNGKLTITRTNGTSGQLLFAPQLIGDFDVQFDYSLFWAPTFAFGDRLQLSVYSDAPVHSYNVGHTQEGSIFGVAVDPSPRYQFGPNTASGKMRVTRTGSSVLMQYFSAGDWVTLQTGTENRDMWVSLDNYIFNGFTAGSSVEIDNFRIIADRFSTSIPEPGACTLMLGGLGLLVGWRRSRRST